MNIIQKTLNKVAEISCAGYATIIKNVEGEVLASGLNTNGQLATGTNTNIKTFTKIDLSQANESPVKNIKAGKTSTKILLENGSVYTARTKCEWRIRN